MAESKNACPIVLLDEIDKISRSDNYPVLPVLLELLEPGSAKTFRDECLEIRCDTSRLIHIATANDIELVDSPILSRFRIAEIKAPDSMQRRAIIKNVFKEIIGRREFEIAPNVIDCIAEIDTDLREVRRQLRESIGRALLNSDRCLEIRHINFQTKSTRQRIGFI
jgi:ATP-dependent Lon protease